MIKRAIHTTITLLLVSYLASNAQQPLSLPSVDATSYSLWQKKDWNELVKFGNYALSKNIDFYYLRVRLGIAYYEQKNYHSAIHHFEKAYKVNAQELYLKEYLYYAYRFAGRYSDAAILASTFPNSLRERIGAVDNSFIDQLTLFYGSSFLTESTPIDNFPNDLSPTADGFQEITRRHSVYSLGLRHDISPKFTLSHAYTNIQKTSFDFLKNAESVKIKDNQKTSVHQYYIAANHAIAKGFSFGYGAHILNVRYPVEVTFFRQGQYYTATQVVTSTDFVGFAYAQKSINYLTLGSCLSVSNLNSATQLQADMMLTIYPMGNLNLYFTSTGSFHTEMYPNNGSRNDFVFDQLLGFKVTKFLWAETFATFGEMKNFIANTGATIYNGTEVTDGRFGGRFYVLINPNVSFIASYSYISKSSAFTETENLSSVYNSISYSNHSITGGIIWDF